MHFSQWNPNPKTDRITQVPVTILSGFLGAGKTTLLNRILSHSGSRKFAVLVNDLGEVNIDASLVRGPRHEEDGAIAVMLELQGGCICCSIQTDLLDALLEVVERFQPDHILVEATGVAEPRAIVRTLKSSNSFGRRGTDFARVANMVTVVDGGNLEQYFKSPDNIGQTRRTHLLNSDPRRPLQELLLEQIECADILILNKMDLLEDEASQRFESYLKTLNQSAEIWACRFGEIDIEKLIQTNRFDEEKTLTSSGWQNALFDNEKGRKHAWKLVESESEVKLPFLRHEHQHKNYGLETYMFNARKPFVESRFIKVLRNELPGVIRAKGFYWTERHPEHVGLISIAGKMLRADYLSEWWHTLIERGEVSLSEVPEVVRKSWLPPYGDRRQELVFIGIDLDRKSIEKALKGCFLSD